MTEGIIQAKKLGSQHIASGAIISDLIAISAVGTQHLAASAVTSAKIASGQVGIPHIYPGAVTSAKIGALAVGTPHIAANAIVSGKVASGGLSPLTSGKIWAGFTGNIAREENKPAGAAVPSGVIAIWHGTIANIPAGWVICDGNNSTPNLLAKFVEGVATAATDPGATGGASTVTLATAQIPSHTHTLGLRQQAAAGAHYANRPPGCDADTIDMTFTSDATGGGGSHENKPLFYDIAFIMKT